MGQPKENPQDKAARERERYLAQMERRDSSQTVASGLTSDYRRAYGPQLSLLRMMQTRQ